MSKIKRALLQACGAVTLATCGFAIGQDFPTRPISIVVPVPPGGPTDVGTRLIAEKVTASIGQSVLVDNRPGGGQQIGAGAVKRAAPDGYTLFLSNIGSHAINPSLYAKLSYDPVKDFDPVVLLYQFPHILLVPPNSPIKSAAELIETARSKPGRVTYASQGIGTGGHLLGEMLKAGIKTDLVHVPYKGSAPAIQDLIAGRADFMFDTPFVVGLVRAGKLRALAVTNARRSALFPDVPTMAEAGLPGYDLNAWFGLSATAGTPRPVIARLNTEFVKALRDPDVVRRLGERGIETAPSSPEEYAALIASEAERLGRVVKASGATAE